MRHRRKCVQALGWRSATAGVLLALLSLAAGCRTEVSPPDVLPAPVWQDAASATSGWVRIEAESADLPLAEAAATAGRLTALLAPLGDGEEIAPITIRWYAVPAHFAAAAHSAGMAGELGGFIQFEGGVIHLPPPAAAGAWRAGLAHELTHWYLHQVGDFAPPGFSESTRWFAVPWWLQEGLATYAEAAALAAPGTNAPPVNSPRLRELQRLIWEHRCPPATAVLAHPFRRGGGSAEYAVAWGLTLDLLHPANQPVPDWSRLRAFLAASRAGFLADPVHDWPARFAVAEHDSATLAAAWSAWAEPIAVARSTALLAPDGTTDWEAAWQRRMLRRRGP